MSHERNEVLASLPRDARDHLLPRMAPVVLRLKDDIETRGGPPRRILFPLSGIVSVVAGPRGQEAEVGLVGRSEMTGAWAFLGTEKSPSASFVQVPGEALGIGWPELTEAMSAFPAIHAACLRGVARLMQQVTDTAWTNARASIAERTARWILLCYERTDLEVMPMTHEFLSLMLGVRRPGVTIALQTLEGAGAIRNTRGKIEIRDVALLREVVGRATPQR